MRPHNPRNFRPLPALFAAVSLLLFTLTGTAASPPTNENGLTPQDQAKLDTLKKQLEPTFQLAAIPKITLPPYVPPTAAEAAHIKNLIRKLADMDVAEVEYLDHLTFMRQPAFDPLPAAANPLEPHIGSQSYWGHHPGPSSPFVALVRLGPRALPFLLASLDDSTPSRRVEYGTWGGNYYESVPANPANTHERRILVKRGHLETVWPDLPHQPHFSASASISVRVGDICFVAVGEIVGRRYWSLGETGGAPMIDVNSPVTNPAIASAVREIWSSDHPSQRLMNSLLLDFSTHGVHKAENGPGLDGWYAGGAPQAPAALRLLYYFPRQSAALIARRLDGLDVQGVSANPDYLGTDREMSLFMKRECANGVSADDFVGSVSWCPESQVRTAVRQIAARTTDFAILPRCFPALDPAKDQTFVWKRCLPTIKRQSSPENFGRWTGSALSLVRDFGGARARPFYRNFLRNREPIRAWAVALALCQTDGTYDKEFLFPMLTDRRPLPGAVHGVLAMPTDIAPAAPARVCDVAAETISTNRKDALFERKKSVADRDR